MGIDNQIEQNSKETAVSPTYESVNSAISAYTTIPFVSALLLAFVTAQNPPCPCQYQEVINSVAIINSMCVSFSLCSIASSLLLIYQASKLLSARGPEIASTHLQETGKFRELARYSTYLALITFVLSYGVCLAGISEVFVAWITSTVLILGVVGVIFCYRQTRYTFNKALHGLQAK